MPNILNLLNYTQSFSQFWHVSFNSLPTDVVVQLLQTVLLPNQKNHHILTHHLVKKNYNGIKKLHRVRLKSTIKKSSSSTSFFFVMWLVE